MEFNDIVTRARSNKKVLAVACADDETVLKACVNAHKDNLCEPVFVGDKKRIEEISKKEEIDISKYEIIDEKDKPSACEKAVRLVSENKAHFLMKGFVDTSVLGKAVLNKEWGLRTGSSLSHVSIFQVNKYHKPFILTDSGFIIKPDIPMKIDIIKNSVKVMRTLGVDCPKVAILCAIEKVNSDMPETTDAAILSSMGNRKQISDCVIDGPLAFDVAISKESAEHKKLKSEVAGDADILVVPDLACGNIMAKTIIYWTECQFAGIIVGAKAPIVLISRSDNEKNKMMSIAFGAAV
ncbi:MAG: bifunctional enoyl-CoA hydratase/phosphate acetyltransferase [bacterium]|nr:bifunctional enoyl-CoA hydratase/phosphate acetyltransferase [bacterium]